MMYKNRHILWAMFWTMVVVLLMYELGRPTTYYVRKGGADTNTGTSWAQAKANIPTINAGDTVLIGEGRWLDYQVIPPNGGTSADITVYGCSTLSSASFLNTTISGGDSITGWSVYSGNVYQATYDPTGDGRNASQTWCLVQNDSMMYPCESLSEVDAAGEWYYNDATNTFYAYCFNGGSPSSREMLASFKPAVLINNEAKDHIQFIGLKFQMGAQGVIEINAGVDSVIFKHCDFAFNSYNNSNNPCLVWNGRNNDVLGNNNAFIACSFHDVLCNRYTSATLPPDSHWGAGAIIYSQHNMVFDSCTFFRCAGDGIHFKAAYTYNYGNTVKNCIFYGSSGYFLDTGVLFSCYFGYDSVYACQFYNITKRGIQLGWDGAIAGNYNQGNNFIGNNTFYRCDVFVRMGGTAPDDEQSVKYNVGYDRYTWASDDDHNFVSFAYETNAGEVEAVTVIDSNYWYDASESFVGYCNSSARNWATWQSTCGFDSNSFNSNPALTSPSTYDVSRPSASQEMDVVYGGKTWHQFGAVQNSDTTIAATRIFKIFR